RTRTAASSTAARGSLSHVRPRIRDGRDARAAQHLPGRRRQPLAAVRPVAVIGVTLDELNHLDREAAEAAFARCCGSAAWTRSMAAARPFASLAAMADTGDAIWRSLGPGDWFEAFASHPKIGEQPRGASWSNREQSGMQSAGDDVRGRI